MQLDFILYEMTAIRYFIPIVIEAKKIDIVVISLVIGMPKKNIQI